MISVASLDHLVLTVQSIEQTSEFYQRVLGMRISVFGQGRTALCFGEQKINLHQAGAEFEPKAKHPTPGSADLCFVCHGTMQQLLAHLAKCDIPIEQGPVQRTGAQSPINSVYFRDPDNNLIELSIPLVTR